GTPLPGVNVLIKGTTVGVATNAVGHFVMTVPDQPNLILQFSFIGMEKKEVSVKGDTRTINVVLEMAAESMKEVVITGIYERKKESFTGSTSTFTANDLKTVGTQNILQSLKTLDPSFVMLENNQFGSDPNRLPDIEIRGKSSLLGMRDELAEDPNQPLFILDGFESSLQAIYNLDINRVASITLLKDAASTAIYGSKAANGVVVVETVKPKGGQLMINYNGSLNISMPDLSSYNLMNAKEKLEFERLAGRYSLGSTNWSAQKEIEYTQLYNDRLTEIARGVNTYWLAEPLRTGINHRHSLYVEGGEGSFLFGIGGSYNGITGVMKDSKRALLSGNIDLIYRVSKFQFSNKFQVETTDTKNPIVPFSTYAAANPYYRKYNKDGEVEKWLENNTFAKAANPLWNATQNSRNKGENLSLSDYFIAEYTPMNSLKLRARFGITSNNNDGEKFYSTLDTRYNEAEALNKGEYFYSQTKTNKYEGEFTATFAQLFKDHRVNLVAGGNLSSTEAKTQGYSVKGFPPGDFAYPSFSKGYPEGGIPTYRESTSRSVSAYVNGGYSYADRYLLDLSYRVNGSSVFGTTKQFVGTWSVGLAWNIHKESFIKDNFDGINMMKIRASIGNPGNQNFSSSMTLTTFKYGFNAYNYFGMSSTLSTLGNPDLEWQTTLDKNVGFDLTILDNRLNIVADYYHKNTDPLLISIGVPTSTGVTDATGNSAIVTNMGRQISQGLTASVQYYFIHRLSDRFTWAVRANLRTEKTELGHIGNSLNELNKYGQSRSTKRYYDGANPDAIWAVRSAGIDPSTGRELFYKKNGEYTYDFSYEDEVIVGESRPKIEGVFGSSFNYKGFSVNFDFRYKTGGKTFNNALYRKVENISISGLNNNQDKRALYERWQKPGDNSPYKDIANAASTPMSSRFVQKDNSLTLESLRIGYEFDNELIKRAGFSSLRLNAYMNDIFRISTIKSERGTDYPFARSVSFSLSFNL
ncbi:MAG: SusC/RagA family TonB-linked outer membrane protein, partial [Odoribacter sp.]